MLQVECVRRSRRHRGCVTVLLTGRFEHMRPRVEQILQAQDLEFDFVGRATTTSTGVGLRRLS